MSQRTGRITHEGSLDLNGLFIPCFVLEDGTRVLSGRGLQEALRIRDKPEEGEKRGGYILPKFLASKAFKPFIDSKLEVANFEPILCYKGNLRYHGYEATVLADICDAVLEARKNGVKMTDRQQIVANECEVLVRALAKVGIIALVDEATGYQYDRERDELQKILKAYVSPEILEWQKTFHETFYREIFRLRKWVYTPIGIRKRPGVVGTYTNQFVYDMLPPGVVQKIKQVTPKNASGNYMYKFHQSLTPDVGREHLRNQLISVTTILSISRSWQEFKDLFARKFGQTAIDFDEPLNDALSKSMSVPEFNKSLSGLMSVPPPRKVEKPAKKKPDNKP